MIKKLFFFFFLLHSFLLHAQNIKTGKWGFEVNTTIGKIVKHSPKINYVPKSISQGLEVAFVYKTMGEKPWHNSLNYPEVGASYQFIRFGEQAVFGDAHVLLGTAKFYLARTKVVNFYARVGGGYAWLTKPFNALKNPDNNIIGSHLNIAAQLRIGAEWKINEMILLNTAFSFTHFSNGSIKQPNYGINMLAGTFGFKVFPQIKNYSYQCQKNKPKKPNEVFIKYTLGLQEKYGSNGPLYPVHAGSVGYGYYTSYGNKVLSGITFEYFTSIADFVRVQELSKRSPLYEATNTSFFIGDEIKLGKIGMYFIGGVYFQKKMMTPNIMYFRLGGNIYFAEMGKHKQYKIFGGSGMKAHLNIADYWEFNAGASAGF